MPVYAECGGLMYLSRNISWKNKTCEMVGSVPGDVEMHIKPQGRGYIQLQETGQGLWPLLDPGSEENEIIYGHEFHYSSMSNLDPSLKFAFNVLRGSGVDGRHDGIIYKNIQANYAHLRNVEGHQWARRFVDFVRSIKTDGNAQKAESS